MGGGNIGLANGSTLCDEVSRRANPLYVTAVACDDAGGTTCMSDLQTGLRNLNAAIASGQQAVQAQAQCSQGGGGAACQQINTAQQAVLNLLNTPATVTTPNTMCPANNPTCAIKYIPLEPLPNVPQDGSANFCMLLNGLFRLLILLGGLVAVGSFVYAGITYMTSEIAGTKNNAKHSLQTSLWGLLLLVSSWLILNTINPQLLVCNPGLNPIGANVASSYATSQATCSGGGALVTNTQGNPCQLIPGTFTSCAPTGAPNQYCLYP